MPASAFLPSTFKSPLPRRTHSPKCYSIPKSSLPDVVIVGSGPAGLATALQLARLGSSVRVLATTSRTPAGFASAGMLAPRAEAVTDDFHDLCIASSEMYPSFVQTVQSLSAMDLNYRACGDFLRPYLDEADIKPHMTDLILPPALRNLEPALGDAVKGARKMPREAHIDNRALMHALRKACLKLGVTIDSDAFVRRIVTSPSTNSVDAMLLADNQMASGGHYIMAAGSWSGELLPGLPVRPVKGQMLCLRAPKDVPRSARLNHVLHMGHMYIVPKEDGDAFFVGATEEHGVSDQRVTAGGVAKLLEAAVNLVPALADYELAETWCGLRPATPDFKPIMGMSEYSNMSLATGYFRNGILLAPVGAKIAAAVATGNVADLDKQLRDLLPNFSYERFLHSDPIKSSQPTQTPQRVEQVISEGNVPKKPEIYLYRVLPDGTNEPVPPPRKNWEAKAQMRYDSPPVEQPDTTTNSPTETFSEAPSAPESTSFGYSDVVPQAASAANVAQAPENISGENDAYEDVMQFRGDQAERTLCEALAKNRAFGRKKSALEATGSTVLSLTDEEVDAFDEAFEEGLEEMRQLGNTFDPNHESVLATRRTLTKLELKNAVGSEESQQDGLQDEGYF